MTLLDPAELTLWHAWKRASETVRKNIVIDVGEATGLSDPDFAVLSRVAEIGHGAMRQGELAALLDWHKSRLSHQITRMESRGLVERRTPGGGTGSNMGSSTTSNTTTTTVGVEIVLTAAGLAAIRQARPVHALAVRRYLLDAIPDGRRDEYLQFFEALSDPEVRPPAVDPAS